MARTVPLPREPRASRRGLPPFSVIFADLKSEVIRLVAGELALLKAEMTQKLTKLGLGAAMFVIAALLGFFAIATLVVAAVLSLALVLPGWLASLLVGVALVIVAGILALIGVRSVKKAMPPLPEKTMASVREDIHALRGGTQ